MSVSIPGASSRIRQTAVPRRRVGYSGNARWVYPGRVYVRSFHISALYSAVGMGDRWPVIARNGSTPKMTLRSSKPSSTPTWANHGEPLAQKVEVGLRERAEPYRLRIVPPVVCASPKGRYPGRSACPSSSTAGVAAASGGARPHVELRGDPVRDNVWNDLASPAQCPARQRLRPRTPHRSRRRRYRGHYTEDVRPFSQRGRSGEIVSDDGSPTDYPTFLLFHGIKGSAHHCQASCCAVTEKKNSTIAASPSGRVRKSGSRDRARSGIAMSRSHHAIPISTRYCRRTLQCRLVGRLRFDGLTAEYFDPVNRYVKEKGKRNGLVDTWVYARDAAGIIPTCVSIMTDAEWDRLARLLEPAGRSSDPAVAPPVLSRS